MAHLSTSAPNLFTITPHDSLGLIGFLYWLCAWAEPGHRATSEELHLAGIDMLKFLLCEIGDAKLEEISKVELVTHRLDDYTDHCFLRVNWTHALLLSEQACPHDESDGKISGNLAESGLVSIMICCESLPVEWQRCETDRLSLESWGSCAGVRVLSLETLAMHPLFTPTASHSIHPLIDEFGRALLPVAAAERRFREIPPWKWNQHAWRGFYRVLSSELGGRLFLKPPGSVMHPYCRIYLEHGQLEILLEKAELSVTLYGPLQHEEKLFRLHMMLDQEKASALGFAKNFQGHELRVTTRLIGDTPEEVHMTVHVTLLENFLILDAAGLIDKSATIGRLVSACGLLDHAQHEVPVISPEEMRSLREVIGIHIAGMRERHFVQYDEDPHADGALREERF